MSEIEELQQSMATAQAPTAAKAPPHSKPALVPVAVAAPVAHVVEEPNVMEEFQGGSGEVSMEETLSNLKDDEPSGPNLIDQAMEAEAAREAAPAAVTEGESATELEETPEEIQPEEPAAEAEAEAEQDELLDEAEAEALNDAVAEEEQAVLEEIESAEQEEEITMAETPRRSGKHSSVSLKLTGEMVLRLSYEFEGQEVTIGFSDGALRVELSDGTEFKIPVRRNSLRKVA